MFPASTPEVTPEVAPDVTTDVTTEVLRLLKVMSGPMNRQSLQEALELKAERNFRLLYLRPAIEAELVEMTTPHKPRSSRQKCHYQFKFPKSYGIYSPLWKRKRLAYLPASGQIS